MYIDILISFDIFLCLKLQYYKIIYTKIIYTKFR